ncbi:uncharacterized protein LOC119719792 [Patiria miniata]|uniref:Uncharacterized protein n=1 Tax=Patiria miniata TaxID=46514 RepID=A0A913YZT4_PATMI|nr:uncharacterized protein LOC119719792 [Patiria miniata]
MMFSKMRQTTLKTTVLGCIRKIWLLFQTPWFKQSLKPVVQATSTYEEDVQDYLEDHVQRLKENLSPITVSALEGMDLVQSKEYACTEAVGTRQICTSETVDSFKENIKSKTDPILPGCKLSLTESQSKVGCRLVAKVLEVGASLEISLLSVVEVSWSFTSWLMAVSLSFQIYVPGSSSWFTTEEPFQKQALAVKKEDSSKDQSSQLQNFSSGFMGVSFHKEEIISSEPTSSGRSGLTPPISSEGKTGTKRKRNTKKSTRNLQKRKMIGAGPEEKLKKPAVVTATGGGSSTNQTSKGQQSSQESTKKQSSTSARVTSSCPRSRNAGGTGASGGTGGEEPPDDDRRGNRSPPPDAAGAADKEQEDEDESKKEGALNIPVNVHNKNKVKDYLRDDQRVTGYYLWGDDDNHVAGDQPATTASPVKSHGRRDGGSFSGPRGRKPKKQPNHAPPVAKNACRFTASLLGVVNQDGHRSPSPTVHTRFGDYKDSEMYQRPQESYPTAGSRSPPRYLSGTPVFGESEEHPNTYKEVPPDKPNLPTRDDASSSQPEPLRGEDASALSDTSSQTQPEVPTSQEIPEDYRLMIRQQSSGQGSVLSQTERVLYAYMRENFLRAAHSQEDPLEMEKLMHEANSLPEDHDQGDDEQLQNH